MYVCLCNGITDHQVKECASEGPCSLEELTLRLGVGAACGRCRECCSKLLEELDCPQAAIPG